MYIEFLEGKKHPAKNADISDTHEHFQDAGYVLTENDLIVDIDSLPKETIQKMISLFNIKTQTVWTERGCHLYFKKPQGFRGAKKVCPLGFDVEYKHIKNTKQVTIKRNGTMREIENDGHREDLPDFLHSRKKLDTLLGMDEGEGRNQALFKHRQNIQGVKAWSSVLRFINNNIFAKPLDEEEFQTVTRDVVLTAGKDDEPAVADFIMTKYNVVKYGEYLYFRHNGEYTSDMDQLNRVVFAECGSQKTRYIDEVIRQMQYRAPLVDRSKAFAIKLENGIIKDGQFIEVDYTDFTPYNINIAYYPDAEPVKDVDDYIHHLTGGDEDYKKLLMETLAHTLITDKEFKRLLARFTIFVGGGGNGKGTMLTIIRKILNDKNCTALSIKDIADERYLVTMQHALANLGDDIQDMPINNEQIKLLKNISTCDYVATRELFKQSKNIEMTTSLIFTSNHIIKSFEKGDSFKRRICWLPMYSKVKTKDKNFITKLTTKEALEYWIRLIMEGYFRLYENERFTESEIVTKFNSQYHEENNGVLLFLHDYDKDYFIGRRAPEVYEEYEIWSNEQGLTVHSKKLVTQSIYDVFGLILKNKTINRKTNRVYMEEIQDS